MTAYCLARILYMYTQLRAPPIHSYPQVVQVDLLVNGSVFLFLFPPHLVFLFTRCFFLRAPTSIHVEFFNQCDTRLLANSTTLGRNL